MPDISGREYLIQVRESLEHIFSGIAVEEARISDTSQMLPAGINGADLRTARDFFYRNFQSMEGGDDFDEPHLIHAFQQYAATAQLIVLHEITVGVLYGALLQIAKQAISIAHGAAGRTCGLGRDIAGLPLAQVIWDARNQALHFEEDAKANTRNTFQRLSDVLGDEYSLDDNPGKNMARIIVRGLLRWTNFDEFGADMLAIVEAGD